MRPMHLILAFVVICCSTNCQSEEQQQLVQLIDVEAGQYTHMEFVSTNNSIIGCTIDSEGNIHVINASNVNNLTTVTTATVSTAAVYRTIESGRFGIILDQSGPNGESEPFALTEFAWSSDQTTFTVGKKLFLPAPNVRDMDYCNNSGTTELVILARNSSPDSPDEIYIANVTSTSAEMVLNNTIDLGSNATANGVKVSGDNLLIAAANATDGEFQSRPLSDPDSLNGSYDFGSKSCYSIGLTPDSNKSLVGTNRVTTGTVVGMDTSDPARPRCVSGVDLGTTPVLGLITDDWPTVLAIQGAQTFQPITITVIDWSEWLAPTVESRLEIPERTRSYVRGRINGQTYIFVSITSVTTANASLRSPLESTRLKGFALATLSGVDDWSLYP